MRESSEMEDFTSQDLQVDFYEKALTGNKIIYIPTGPEAIFVATFLIKKLSRDIRFPYHQGGKKTMFIVDNESSVIHRRAYITRQTDLTCRGYTKDMNVDIWTNKIWKQQLKKYEVMIMTAQLYVDILERGLIILDRVNLIVFDGCHQAVGDHPMRKIMKYLKAIPENQQPRILGLSTTILNSKIEPSNIEDHIHDLETTFCSKIITNKPRVRVTEKNYIEFDDFLDTSINEVIELVLDHVKKIIHVIPDNSKLMRLISDFSKNLTDEGLYGKNKLLLLHLIQLLEVKQSIENDDRELYLEFILSEMNVLRKLLRKEMEKKTCATEYESIMSHSSGKVLKLLDLLKNHTESIKENENFRCIIFVDNHSKAIVLHHILKNMSDSDEYSKFLKSDYVMNYSNVISESCVHPLVGVKRNKEVLIRFSQHLTNCLIIDSEIEEGIDVSQCSLVVFYDQPKSFSSYLQSKGHVRNSSDQLKILISKNDYKSLNTYVNWEEMDKKLYEIIKTNHLHGELIPKDMTANLCSTKIEPYSVTNVDGIKSTLTDDSAIDLVEKYCSSLNVSKFDNYCPTYVLHSTEKNDRTEKYFRVSLKLPRVSPLQEIINGNVMSSISLAKRSAAMEGCIALHKIGELNDKLLPRENREIIENINSYLTNWRNEPVDEKKSYGSFGYDREHELIHAESLSSAQPMPNCEAYLHIINAEPIDSVFFDAANRAYYNCLNKKAGYAILCSKKMPVLPIFPIFMNSIHHRVNVEVNYRQVSVSSDEIAKLRRFHFLVFNDVLEITEDYMVFDNDNTSNSFFIVPVDEDWRIDWNVVEKYKEIAQIHADSPVIPAAATEAPNESSSMEICKTTPSYHPLLFNVMKDSDWQLVTPRHRPSDHIYFVIEVCHEMNPMTPFPTYEASSYFQYFKQKHKIEATNLQQPMILVKPLQKNINFTLPYGDGRDSFGMRRKETKGQHFIPEFCKIVTFTSLHWMKARLLPSILHRINQLLIAEDLRQEITCATGLGFLNVEKWPPIELTPAEENRIKLTMTKPTNLVNSDESINDKDENYFKPKNALPTDPIINDVDFLSLESKNFFPWPKEKEPLDLYKNLEQVQFIDIKYSHQFNSKLMHLSHHVLSQEVITCAYSKRSNIKPPKLRVLNVDASENAGPSPTHIMCSLTSPLCTDILSSDRLKIPGYSFMKYIVSIYLFETFPNQSKSYLTTCRDHILGTHHLYFCGEAKNIPGRLKVDSFIPSGNFIPPSFCVPRKIRKMLKDNGLSTPILYEFQVSKDEKSSGTLFDSTEKKLIERVLNWPEKREDIFKQDTDNLIGVLKVKDKYVADSVGALTGSYLESIGVKGTVKLLEWFGVVPNNFNIDKVFSKSPPNPRLDVSDLNEHMPWINFIQKSIGYSFENRSYLLQAFTHATFTGHSITSDYRRLEFLGEAIIEFLISLYASDYCQSSSIEDLADLKSALTNNISLARLTVKYGLHTALLHYSPSIAEAVDKFVAFLMDRKFAFSDDIIWNLYEEDECNLAENIEVPKVLADIFESTIGAIYLDSGKDLEKVWEILYGLMKNEIDIFSKFVPQQPLRRIMELEVDADFSKVKKGVYEKQVMVPLRVQIADKPKFFHGFGTTRALAKRAGAKQALKYLRKINYD